MYINIYVIYIRICIYTRNPTEVEMDLAKAQVVHLVLHQRDERRDHDSDGGLAHDCEKLVAQRLATPCQPQQGFRD